MSSEIDNDKVFMFRKEFRKSLSKRERKQFLLDELNLASWVGNRLNKQLLIAAKNNNVRNENG